MDKREGTAGAAVSFCLPSFGVSAKMELDYIFGVFREIVCEEERCNV